MKMNQTNPIPTSSDRILKHCFNMLFSCCLFVLCFGNFHVSAAEQTSQLQVASKNHANLTFNTLPCDFGFRTVAQKLPNNPIKLVINQQSTFKNSFVRVQKLSLPLFSLTENNEVPLCPEYLEIAQSEWAQLCLSYEFLRLNVLSAKHHPPTVS